MPRRLLISSPLFAVTRLESLADFAGASLCYSRDGVVNLNFFEEHFCFYLFPQIRESSGLFYSCFLDGWQVASTIGQTVRDYWPKRRLLVKSKLRQPIADVNKASL